MEVRDFKSAEYVLNAHVSIFRFNELPFWYVVRKTLAEVEYKLSSLLKHGHPIETLDQIWCWRIDIDINQYQKLGNDFVTLVKKHDKFYLKCGAEKLIRVFELSKIIEELKK